MTTSEPNVVLIFEAGTMLPCYHEGAVEGMWDHIESNFAAGHLFVVVEARARAAEGTRLTSVAVRIDSIFSIVEADTTKPPQFPEGVIAVELPEAYASRKDMN